MRPTGESEALVKTLIYDGPFGAVDVPSVGLTATKGEPIEMDDVTAENLIRQGWREVTLKKGEAK
jgi:hypothetical protein